MVAANLMLMAVAIAVDALIGDPAWLYRLIPHPVTWMGSLIGWADRHFNRENHGSTTRRFLGIAALSVLIVLFGACAFLLARALGSTPLGLGLQGILASTLLAQRSLYDHVRAVLIALRDAGTDEARIAVGQIVGRDTSVLDQPAIRRAAIESLAENLSDGVVAPLFWGLIAGLPGIVIYKIVNTADSMIGHRTERHLYFGWTSARIDDLLNWIPARLTGLMIAAVSGSRMTASFFAMMRDARAHRSPNAGWPEAAMAGALGVRLSGPRLYHGAPANEPWLNESGVDPDNEVLRKSLNMMVKVCALEFVLVVASAFYLHR